MTMDRRLFLGTSAVAAGLALPGRADADADADEVGPTEDLMREHGVLRRILIVYDETIRRVTAREAFPRDALVEAARIVRDFIENYHEKDEEDFVFPRLGHHPLVPVLLAQHVAGRKITDEILRTRPWPVDLPALLGNFNRMYRAHAAREDTVIFPAFRAAVGAKELDRLKEVFEREEDALPHGGFDKMVAAVAQIEDRFGIADLAKFTA
jgi:hemerythrin-like domain-containing protein